MTDHQPGESDTLDLAARFERAAGPAADLAKTAGAIKRITARLSADDGYAALKKVEKDLTALQAAELDTRALATSLRSAADALSSWLNLEWDRRAVSFGLRLEEHFREREVRVERRDGELLAGPLLVRLYPAKDRAALVFADEEITDKLPLREDKVYAGWVKTLGQLERRATEPEELADKLVAAYRAELKASDQPKSTRIRLPDLHFRLFAQRQTKQVRRDPRTNKLKEYPRYQFAWDLSALLERPELLDTTAGRLECLPASESAARSDANSVACRVDGVVRRYGSVRLT